MSRKFNDFDELSRKFKWGFGIGLVLWLIIVGLIVYIAYHFLAKYW